MEHTVTLTDEQLTELETLVSNDLEVSRAEHRRTDDREYRGQIQRRIDLLEGIHRALEQSAARTEA